MLPAVLLAPRRMVGGSAGGAAVLPPPRTRPAAAAAGDPGERITQVVGAVTVSEAVEGSGLHLVQCVFAEHGRYGRLDRDVLPDQQAVDHHDRPGGGTTLHPDADRVDVCARTEVAGVRRTTTRPPATPRATTSSSHGDPPCAAVQVAVRDPYPPTSTTRVSTRGSVTPARVAAAPPRPATVTVVAAATRSESTRVAGITYGPSPATLMVSRYRPAARLSTRRVHRMRPGPVPAESISSSHSEAPWVARHATSPGAGPATATSAESATTPVVPTGTSV